MSSKYRIFRDLGKCIKKNRGVFKSDPDWKLYLRAMEPKVSRKDALYLEISTL